MKVLVINQYAGNKGDRAVAFFILRELSRAGVTDIALSTHDRRFWRFGDFPPEAPVRFVPWGWSQERFDPRRRMDWERHRLMRRVAFPIARNRLLARHSPGIVLRFLCNREFLRAVRSSDLVVSTGGHILTTRFAADCVGNLTFDMMITILVGKPLAIWSQTIGPFAFMNRRNESAVRTILRSTWRTYVRDDSSAESCLAIGVDPTRLHRTTESVLGLEDMFEGYRPPTQRPALAGITVYNAETRTVAEHTRYVTLMASMADHLANRGLTVTFFPHELKGAVVDDRRMIREIVARMTRQDAANVRDVDVGTPEHLSLVGECRMFVAHKTHSVVFALTVGTPVLAISYHPKTLEFMRLFGMTDHCVDETGMACEQLKDMADAILENADNIGLRQRECSRRQGQRVRGDFRKMVTDFADTLV